MLRDTAFTPTLCADVQRFSLHAAVRWDAHERQRLAQPCRTIKRPALANERVQCNAAGQVVLKLKSPWRDGTTPIVMSPLEFMQRLAASGRAGAPASAAPDPIPWSAGAQRQAEGAGGAGGAASDSRRVGAHCQPVRLRE